MDLAVVDVICIASYGFDGARTWEVDASHGLVARGSRACDCNIVTLFSLGRDGGVMFSPAWTVAWKCLAETEE